MLKRFSTDIAKGVATVAGAMYIEDVLMDIFSSLPFPSGTVNSPENVRKKGCFLQSRNFGDE